MYYSQTLLAEQRALDAATAFKAKGPGKSTVLKKPMEGKEVFYPPLDPCGGPIGPPKPIIIPALLRPAILKQRGQVRRLSDNPTRWLPAWVREHIEKDPSPESRIEAIVGRLKKDPGEASLLEAQALLNELGRDPETAKLVHAAINKKLIHLLRSSAKK
jgi:hypothetical protein